MLLAIVLQNERLWSFWEGALWQCSSFAQRLMLGNRVSIVFLLKAMEELNGSNLKVSLMSSNAMPSSFIS